jgi:ABC-type polysaccharide/polyol phosphate export permease
MIPWNFVNNVVNQSGFSYINNEALIKKIYIPKIIFPISIILNLFVDMLLSLAVLIFLIIVLGGNISWVIFYVAIALILLFIFALGIGLIVSVATVFYRDLQYVLSIAMQGLFYITPVLYVKDTIPKNLAMLVSINPMSPLIDIFRSPISYRLPPSNDTLLMAILVSFSTFAIGLSIFINQEKKIIFRL